jgi:hypothetical protein
LNYQLIFSSGWRASMTLIILDRYSLPFKITEPLQNSCSTHNCISKCYFLQLGSFCCSSNLSKNVMYTFCALHSDIIKAIHDKNSLTLNTDYEWLKAMEWAVNMTWCGHIQWSHILEQLDLYEIWLSCDTFQSEVNAFNAAMYLCGEIYMRYKFKSWYFSIRYCIKSETKIILLHITLSLNAM